MRKVLVTYTNGTQKTYNSVLEASNAVGKTNKSVYNYISGTTTPRDGTTYSWLENQPKLRKNRTRVVSVFEEYTIRSQPSDYPEFLRNLKTGQSILCLVDNRSGYGEREVYIVGKLGGIYYDVNGNPYDCVVPVTRTSKLEELSKELLELTSEKKQVDVKFKELSSEINRVKKELNKLGVN